MARLPNQYQISRSPNGEHWTTLGEFFARSARESILKARRRDQSKDAYWRTVVMRNRTGRNLGKAREFTFPPPQGVVGADLTPPSPSAENSQSVLG